MTPAVQGNEFSTWDALFTQRILSTKKSKQLWFETAKGEYPCFFEQSAPLSKISVIWGHDKYIPLSYRPLNLQLWYFLGFIEM